MPNENPNENLTQQLRLARRIIDTDDPTIRTGAAIRLAELVEALDDQLRRGGLFPEAWTARRGIDVAAVELLLAP